MNHCLLEAEVLEAPQIRFTQDNQMPIAEMTVRIDGLRPEDPPGQLKVVGWGNLAQELQNRVRPGQRLVLEGRMRINSITRQDGVKEKRAELTLARLHPLTGAAAASPAAVSGPPAAGRAGTAPQAQERSTAVNRMAPPQPPVWNASPLVPQEVELGEDDIPF
ncbi:MAG: single-stranded DNA-binding protein [Synechococcus sp.]|nr:single-stranded DNA-binding protein [Synechococcus sp.]